MLNLGDLLDEIVASFPEGAFFSIVFALAVAIPASLAIVRRSTCR